MKSIWIFPFSIAMFLGIANLGWAHGGGSAGGSSAHGGSSRSHATVSRSSSHSRATSSSHHLASTRSSRHSTHSTKNGGLPGKKNGFVDGLPPGQESRLDRGKGLSPGWQNKVSFHARSDKDKEAKDRSPGRELNSDREENADRDH